MKILELVGYTIRQSTDFNLNPGLKIVQNIVLMYICQIAISATPDFPQESNGQLLKLSSKRKYTFMEPHDFPLV
jgi:hypothetical protein